MSAVFLKIVNMSISASWLILAVLFLRLILKRAPKWITVLLWGFVAIRLLCPFSIESMFSLIPSAQIISPEIMLDPTPQIHTGIHSLNNAINPIIATFAPDQVASMNPLQFWIPFAAIMWITGIGAMLIYTAVSYLLLRCKVATAVLLENQIYQSEYVDSPFVLGLIKPKIYLPFQMDNQNLTHVIAHEQAHIRRKDHWWKPLGFILLALHWFNPLMWLGYILLCRDIELACDEKVIKEMDNDAKADYTQALVACSVNRRRIAACPLAFGEVGVKKRVTSVLHYKKPAFWIILAAIVICIVVAVCFLTDPATEQKNSLSIAEGIVAVSGENTVPLIRIPADTPFADAIPSLHWLPIAPDKEAITPFDIYENGECVLGHHYTVYDVQTFEKLDYLLPSGLEPQTSLFHNADPTSDYIVLFTLSGMPDGERFAFGVTFDDTIAVNYIIMRLAVKYPWVQEYTPGTDGIIGNVDTQKYLQVSKDFTIGANRWGMAVFKNPHLAFLTLTKLYGDGIRAIQVQYDLAPFSESNYQDYKTYGWQTTSGSKEAQEQARFITGFLDIYENSFIDDIPAGAVEITSTVIDEQKVYYKLSDGTYRTDGRNYKYRLEISGRMHDAATESTFVYLSNLETITFDEAWRAAGYSSNSEDYFAPEEAVLVNYMLHN